MGCLGDALGALAPLASFVLSVKSGPCRLPPYVPTSHWELHARRGVERVWGQCLARQSA